MTKSIETKQPLVRLALAVADALEDPSTPGSLRDPLNEIASQLIDQFSGGSIAVELRALATAAASGKAETESRSIAASA